LNDFFYPRQLKGINKMIIEIYNRWGQKLTETDDILNGWDGKYKGQDCPDGVYLWVVHYITITNESKTLRGLLTLIK
jgi:gliding motility-associated-like protein